MAVVKIKVDSKDRFEKHILARILLDNGSQSLIISEAFVRKHRLQTSKSVPTYIGGITGNSVSSVSIIRLSIALRYSSFKLELEVGVVSQITFSIETQLIEDTIKQNSSFQFAESTLPYSNVDIILGAEYYESCILNESRKSNGIFLRNSKLGWVISGPYVKEQPLSKSFCSLTTLNIQHQLKLFWELEEATDARSTSSEHDLCVKFFEETYSRDTDGRFIVKLPFK